jgi:hypothetical protein
MAKTPEKFCTYAGVKIDDQIHPLAHAAAVLSGQALQDWLSDVANQAAALVLKREPVKRRPPEPKSRRPKS